MSVYYVGCSECGRFMRLVLVRGVPRHVCQWHPFALPRIRECVVGA